MTTASASKVAKRHQAGSATFGDVLQNAERHFLQGCLRPLKKVTGRHGDWSIKGNTVPFLNYKGVDASDFELDGTISLSHGDSVTYVKVHFDFTSAYLGKIVRDVNINPWKLTPEEVTRVFHQQVWGLS